MASFETEQAERTAQAYNDLLVPALFQPFAKMITDTAATHLGAKVLDVGCGTGALTHELAARVGENGSVTGLDANPGMLSVAQRNGPGIDWRLGDAASLPFADGIFDVVVSQFALMLFEDPEKSLREMWRVLSPEGRLTVAVFDQVACNQAYGAIADIYENRVGSEIANALRFPFSLGEVDKLEAVFDDAGIVTYELKAIRTTAQFASAIDLTHADVKGWFPFAGFEVSQVDIDAIIEDLERELATLSTSDGSISFDAHAHVVTATKS